MLRLLPGRCLVKPPATIAGILLLLAALAAVPVALANDEYRIPTLDSREASPPTVRGRVIDISGNILLLERGGAEVAVLTSPETHFFTEPGGLIGLNDICLGSIAQVWHPSPDVNPRIAPAVTISVAEACPR